MTRTMVSDVPLVLGVTLPPSNGDASGPKLRYVSLNEFGAITDRVQAGDVYIIFAAQVWIWG